MRRCPLWGSTDKTKRCHGGHNYLGSQIYLATHGHINPTLEITIRAKRDNMDFIVRNIGGLGYSATRKGGKATAVLFSGKTTASAFGCGWTRSTSRSRQTEAALAAVYDPTSSFVANDKHEARP